MPTAVPTVRPTAGAVAALLVLAVATGVLVDASWAEGSALLALEGLSWLAFGVGTLLVLRMPVRAAVVLLLAGGAVLQLVAALSHDPRRSDDVYRYVWDGRVQAAGIDPYRYAPSDPALAHLRDPWLFPAPAGCAESAKPPGCTRINRPDERTIYPPVAQLVFLGVHVVAPYGHLLAWQLVCGALAVGTGALLVGVLRRTRGDPRLAVLWAWCPVVALEAGNGAHIDVLAALLVVGGLACRGPVWRGALLGVAIAVKLYPALVVAAALRRRGPVVAGVAAMVVALSYVPHVVAVGPRVLGYLPGYLAEEGYAAGTRFALLSLVVPEGAATAVAVTLVALAAATTVAVTLRRSAQDRPWDAALPFVGTVFLVTTPYQGWYGLLIVALVPLAARPEWLAVAAASFPLYTVEVGERLTTARVSYGLALVVVLLVTLQRRAGATGAPAPSGGRRCATR